VLLSGASIADLGDADVIVTDVERTFSAIEETIVSVVRRGIRPLVLGGDHSVSLPIVRGLGDRPLGILQFDAHLDYGDEFGGARYTSSTVMRRIREMGKVKSLVHAGIRGLRTSRTSLSETWQDGNVVLSASDLSAHSDVLAERLDRDLEWYISIDLDVLDPSQAPEVSSPEPGGLTCAHLVATLATLRRRLRVVGCDIVELNPLIDPTGISALAAVYLAISCASLLNW
jgi:agmatinase